jgi:hypothetical protein
VKSRAESSIAAPREFSDGMFLRWRCGFASLLLLREETAELDVLTFMLVLSDRFFFEGVQHVFRKRIYVLLKRTEI